jgi:uncharacterized protein (DUF433 family)
VLIVAQPSPAFTSDQVIRLTGVSRRRLAYWLERGVVSADVDVARGRGRVRLWSFTNLVEVRVALWLRDRVSLQLLGKVVRALRRRGYKSPLAEVRVAVLEAGRRKLHVVVQGADGAWEEPLSGQLVMELVLPLGRFQEELHEAIEYERRAARAPGKIERKRGRLGSEPVFAGTRVPVAAVQRLHAAGWDAERIIGAYPGLTVEDIEAASRAAADGPARRLRATPQQAAG